MATDTMRVQGKDLTYQKQTISQEECLLDPENPRVQTLVGRLGPNVAQEQLEELLWNKDPVKALAQSVFQNGGVREPLLVQQKNGKFLVREGNCRTVACRHLLKQHPGDVRFATVPAWVFNGELTEEDLAVVLADMHVASKIQWPLYEQAKHVWDLHHKYGKTFDWLSDHLRMSKSKISQFLDAYGAMTEYLKQSNTTDVRKFSFFIELMRIAALRKPFNDSDEFKKQVHNWITKERLTDSRQVRNLPRILDSKEATRMLDEKGFQEAERVLIWQDPSLSSDLYQAVKAATHHLKEVSAAEIGELKDKEGKNPQKLIMLRNLHRALQDLSTLAGIQL